MSTYKNLQEEHKRHRRRLWVRSWILIEDRSMVSMSECVWFNIPLDTLQVISGWFLQARIRNQQCQSTKGNQLVVKDQAWIPPEPFHHVTMIQLYATASMHSIRVPMWQTQFVWPVRTAHIGLSLIHIWRCRRIERCRSRWSPYH